MLFSLVQRNLVPSLHMRCMITASLRASATFAFLRPRRLATFIAQAFSHDHFFVQRQHDLSRFVEKRIASCHQPHSEMRPTRRLSPD